MEWSTHGGAKMRRPSMPVAKRPSLPSTKESPDSIFIKRGGSDANDVSVHYSRMMEGRVVVLDVTDPKTRRILTKEIEAMGGLAVECFSDENPPFVVVSDHAFAAKLETMKLNRGVKINDAALKKLPLLLKLAVIHRVRVRTEKSFYGNLLSNKKRMKKLGSVVLKSSQQRDHDRHSVKLRIRELIPPFVKIEDFDRHYQPCFKELHHNYHFNTLYFGKYYGHSMFHKANADQQIKREQQLAEEEKLAEQKSSEVVDNSECLVTSEVKAPKKPAKKNKKGFCEICNRSCDDMRVHYQSKEHLQAISQPGLYDELDKLLGSFVEDIICPQMRPLSRREAAGSSPSTIGLLTDYNTYSECDLSAAL